MTRRHRLFRSPFVERDEERKERKAFDEPKKDSRRAAHETLNLIATMKAAPRKKAAAPAPAKPAASIVPPPPPGFELAP